MDDILYLVHNTYGYNNEWKELETAPFKASEHHFPGVYFTLITKDNLKTEDLYGYQGDILIFSWNLDKAVKKIKQESKKGYDIGNEVVFHDNIPMKYLCLVINLKSIDLTIADKYKCKLSNIILPHYEIYNNEEADKTKIPFYCLPFEENYTGIGKYKISSEKFYKKMAILCNVNQQQSRKKIIEDIKNKMNELYNNREKQKLKEFNLIF